MESDINFLAYGTDVVIKSVRTPGHSLSRRTRHGRPTDMFRWQVIKAAVCFAILLSLCLPKYN